MKQFTTHGATHFQRKACVKDAMQQQAPPTVISFVGNEADFKKDLDNLEDWVKGADAFSQEKCHYMTLICQIVQNEALPDKIRERAARLIIKHSDERQTVQKFFGSNFIAAVKAVAGWKW